MDPESEEATMMDEKLRNMSIEEKRALARKILEQRAAAQQDHERGRLSRLPPYTDQTYDMFLASATPEPVEAARFHEWVESVAADDAYMFEQARGSAQRTRVTVQRPGREPRELLNFSSYNYLGLGYHPEVIEAAKAALDRFGLGAASSPVISGTLEIHRALEEKLLQVLDLPGHGVSLFSSGYAVNTGTVSAVVKEGQHVVLDRSVHMSLLEGAQLSRAHIHYFRHNDPENLDRVLSRLDSKGTRTLVCTEGVFSADGDLGPLRAIVSVAKKHGAMVLVDEAHSILVAGPNGRGVSEAEGVLGEVDFLVLTFSKAFGGVGGAVVARRELTRYINWYARCRMFSCALDSAVTGGMVKALEIAAGPEGAERRRRIRDKARHLREALRPHVSIGESESWIIPVMFGADRLTIPLSKHLHEEGLDTSIMQFPAVNKNEARIRVFVTSEHAREDLDRAAEILRQAAVRFGFAR
jgi:7-keto-8-aminopelargonate synthetase-like enzyme